MVFLKNNTTGSGSESLQQKSSNLKQQEHQLLNNKLPNTNFKKDINTLASSTSTTTTTALTESAKESQQPKQNKTSVIRDTKRDNNVATDSNSASSNPFTVKLEVNIVVVALFAVALGLRLYAIDQPNSVV